MGAEFGTVLWWQHPASFRWYDSTPSGRHDASGTRGYHTSSCWWHYTSSC
ncbi:MAG: hypothetical protein FJY95_11290 [Candidatus Handelsmanbacteria bacterium]|nr:hypothetical protein [Candidatus Handelsmanbacteria bacterium]